MNNEEKSEPESSDGNRVFLDVNMSNWEQLSQEQQNEISQRIYLAALAGLGGSSRIKKLTEEN